MAQLPCFKGSWAIYPPFLFFDIDGATQDSEPSTFTPGYAATKFERIAQVIASQLPRWKAA